MKAVVATFNQEKALVGAFSMITKLRMDLFESLISNKTRPQLCHKYNSDISSRLIKTGARTQQMIALMWVRVIGEYLN